MADAALRITQEFLRAPDAETRKRGVRALAALPSSEASAMLLERALNDEHPDIRGEAERAMVEQVEADAALVVPVLEARLREQPRVTYALLGRLRAMGSRVELMRQPLMVRLRRAATLWVQIQRQLGKRYWSRGVLPSLVAVTIGLMLVGTALQLLGLNKPADAYLHGWIAVVPSILTALLVAPTQMHFDRNAGVIADAIAAALLAAVAVAVWGIAVLSAADAGVAIVAAMVVVVTARVAVALLGGSVAIPILGFLWTMLGAAFAGILAGWCAAALVAPLASLTLDEVNCGAWLPVVAVAYAWLFAWLDRPQAVNLTSRGRTGTGDQDVRQRNFPRRVGYVTAGAIYTGVGVLVWVLAPGTHLSVKRFWLGERIELAAARQTRTIAETPARLTVDLLPARCAMPAVDGGTCKELAWFEVRRSKSAADDYTIELTREGTGVTGASAKEQFPPLDKDKDSTVGILQLGPGAYALTVMRGGMRIERDTLLAQLSTAVQTRTAGRIPADLTLSAQLPRLQLMDDGLALAERRELVQKLVKDGFSDFAGLQLEQVDLARAANLFKAQFSGAKLRRANFESAQIGAADFSGADLRQANLTRAYLDNSNLASANLGGADLSYANLANADLSGADLSGATVVDADMTRAKVSEVKLGKSSRFDGTAWWFADGWSDANLELLEHLSPHHKIGQSARYLAELSRLDAALRGASTPRERAIALNERAWLRATRGVDLDRALSDARDAIKLLRALGTTNDKDATLGPVLNTAGYILLQQADHERAAELLREAAGLLGGINCPGGKTDGADNMYHLGVALERLGQQEDAEAAFACATGAGYRPTYERLLTPRPH